ncbi:MAG: ZIP family metal transporter [Thermoanaerobaculia bacterium]|nr:ZIP family metal transporter [Thermoanaerobaculia bacterium]
MHPALTVFLYGAATAVSTGLGALPFALVRRISETTAAHANAVAAGLMLGASFGLAAEGTAHGAWQTFAGVNLGVVFILLTQRVLARHELSIGEVRGAGARRVLLMLVVMTVHSFAEGVAIGASFAGGMTLATLITVAIAVHNVPEGIAISAVLRPQGASIAACAGWSVFSSLPQPLMAVPAFLFVDAFRPALPYGVGFAAGAMVFMVFVELLPEALEHAGRAAVGLLVTLALVAMILFQAFL